ncbi:signal peptidase I [Candidatus Woesearchaeota archaeon]|nr:signal peptidase I [Candidatus Woesearchaeota archaeon]
MNSRKLRRAWKRAWYFIWEDDSWASWFVNIILAFLIIKFLIYPGLGFAFGTSHPIVAVVSSSMEHDGRFDDWWQSPAVCDRGTQCTQSDFYSEKGIGRSDFEGFRFWNGFNRGDLMVLIGAKPEKVRTGDVIVFQASRPDPIIHRVIDTNKQDGDYSFTTKGDHNAGVFYFETHIPEDAVIGKAVFRLPYLGYVKIAFVGLLNLIGVTW